MLPGKLQKVKRQTYLQLVLSALVGGAALGDSLVQGVSYHALFWLRLWVVHQTPGAVLPVTECFFPSLQICT